MTNKETVKSNSNNELLNACGKIHDKLLEMSSVSIDFNIKNKEDKYKQEKIIEDVLVVLENINQEINNNFIYLKGLDGNVSKFEKLLGDWLDQLNFARSHLVDWLRRARAKINKEDDLLGCWQDGLQKVNECMTTAENIINRLKREVSSL